MSGYRYVSVGNGLFARTRDAKIPARTTLRSLMAQQAAKPSGLDPELAQLIHADQGRTMRSEPQDVVALLESMEDEETGR